MLKTILRIGVILLVAGAVSAAIYVWGSNTSVASAGLEGGPGNHENRGLGEQRTVPSGLDGNTTLAMRGGRGGDHDDISVAAGLSGVGKNLGIVALVTLGVVLVQKGFGSIRRWRRSRSTA